VLVTFPIAVDARRQQVLTAGGKPPVATVGWIFLDARLWPVMFDVDRAEGTDKPLAIRAFLIEISAVNTRRRTDAEDFWKLFAV
jgi:hypothetical protein